MKPFLVHRALQGRDHSKEESVRRRRPIGFIALAASAACLVLGAIPATAGATRRAGSSHRGARTALTLAIPVSKSTVTAGYVSQERGITSVSTTFEVPSITNCTPSTNAGMGPVVILLGPHYFVGAGAEAECQNGTTTFIVAINHNGSEAHPLTVAAQDEISVTVTVGRTVVGVRIDDKTSNKVVAQNVPKSTVTAAELGDDTLFQGHQEVPIPQFTDHKFASTEINGKVLRLATPLTEDELVKGSTVLIAPSAISASGASFVMRFLHAS